MGIGSIYIDSMEKLSKLTRGDKVAILSPSFAAPGMFPKVYELGLSRLRDEFGLEPVEYPTTRKLGASQASRAEDLISAFEDKQIKAVISTIGGDDQVTYVKNLPLEPFANNPKPFFGYSDNSHLINFLWLLGIPSYYGGSIMTQYAMQSRMDDFTVDFLNVALFEGGEIELKATDEFNDVGLDWADDGNLNKRRVYEENEGWFFDGEENVQGVSWGGCLESIDEMLRNHVDMPTSEDFGNIVLFFETSEEIPSAEYVSRVLRALGELDLLTRVKAVLVGRAKAWNFSQQNTPKQRVDYRRQQRESILKMVRNYNQRAVVVQNLDIGHTDPQIPLPVGRRIQIFPGEGRIVAEF